MLQMGTNIMANQVKTPIQNYFESVVWKFDIWDSSLVFFLEQSRDKKNRNKPLCSNLVTSPVEGILEI
jgi:hypothetical protein